MNKREVSWSGPDTAMGGAFIPLPDHPNTLADQARQDSAPASAGA